MSVYSTVRKEGGGGGRDKRLSNEEEEEHFWALTFKPIQEKKILNSV